MCFILVVHGLWPGLASVAPRPQKNVLWLLCHLPVSHDMIWHGWLVSSFVGIYNICGCEKWLWRYPTSYYIFRTRYYSRIHSLFIHFFFIFIFCSYSWHLFAHFLVVYFQFCWERRYLTKNNPLCFCTRKSLTGACDEPNFRLPFFFLVIQAVRNYPARWLRARLRAPGDVRHGHREHPRRDSVPSVPWTRLILIRVSPCCCCCCCYYWYRYCYPCCYRYRYRPSRETKGCVPFFFLSENNCATACSG